STFSKTAVNSVFSSRWGVTRSRNWTLSLFDMLFDPSFCRVAKHFCWISGHDTVCRYIFGYDTPRSHKRVLADDYVGQDRASRSNRGAFFYQGRLHFPVAFRLQLSVPNRCAGVAVIDKRDAVADKHVIFDRYTFADECVAGNLAVVSDL